MDQAILDVDLLAFEQGSRAARTAVVDGVRRSLATGFVYTTSDLPGGLLDQAYEMLGDFFALPQAEKDPFEVPESSGQTGYTGLLVETAANSSVPDWKEMLNWSSPTSPAHPLRRRYPHLYPEQVLPEAVVPGITATLLEMHLRIAELQRRFLRVIAEGLHLAETFFDGMVQDAPTLSRAIRYPPMAAAPGHELVWAAPHGDINLITALPRATGPGLQVLVDGQWVEAKPPEAGVIINTGIMLERLSNGLIPVGWHRVVAPAGMQEERLSVVQFCHPRPWTSLGPLASCITPENPQRYSAVQAADALEEVLYQIGLLGKD